MIGIKRSRSALAEVRRALPIGLASISCTDTSSLSYVHTFVSHLSSVDLALSSNELDRAARAESSLWSWNRAVGVCSQPNFDQPASHSQPPTHHSTTRTHVIASHSRHCIRRITPCDDQSTTISSPRYNCELATQPSASSGRLPIRPLFTMDRYEISSMFGQGTFGRLYKAHLRADLTIDQLPGWVAQQPRRRRERRDSALQSQTDDEKPHPEHVAECAYDDQHVHDECASTRATPCDASAHEDDDGGASGESIASIREEMVVIKEVPFQGLPPQEQQDILNEVSPATELAFSMSMPLDVVGRCAHLLCRCWSAAPLGLPRSA
jgi:hypothetical protein